ncbi:hypothetical protein MUK42_36359 [Musa troglodytarum]|uniref:Uncharacterized protein n=1 Tax=Musa troglodytarum TaxID=320322 RepID=A0A9E7H7K5_9LILI|nr:hypothetical protein MUK42_12659 [Musa troglodytarum]URE29189.1 hypothetical protein MUK42_36359 [Musa troglodytarum]
MFRVCLDYENRIPCYVKGRIRSILYGYYMEVGSKLKQIDFVQPGTTYNL